MDINSAYPGKYVQASDLQGRDVTVTISHIQIEDVGDDHKPVVYFVGKSKGFVLNKTNASSIASIYGYETDNWSGSDITIFATQCDYQGRQVSCIRVRLQTKQAPNHQPLPQPDPTEEIPF